MTAQPVKPTRGIDTVHIIFKTHLDIGFTDFAANVTKQYFQRFIPAALDTAERLAAEGGEAQFVWTVGSWLVYEFLEQATPKQRRRMERAIENHQISWLGLPFTMHTELLDASLFRFALSLAHELDQRYGKKTIAAKMTDVPGHTIGIVPLMAEAGIRFMHIGVNAASAVPKTPPLFDWTLGKDSLRMMVHGTYGGVTVLPGFKHALYFAHTNDNHGPQPIPEIKGLFDRLKTQFPGAKVKASNLNAYAKELMKYKRVPKYDQEIGDNWIRGVGTDPKKVSQFKHLLTLRNQWLRQRKSPRAERQLQAFSRKLLMVAEHTWGLDEKTHLNDFKLYTAPQFARLRKTAPARKMEQSWQEQRNYISQAIAALGPGRRQREARTTLRSLEPTPPDLHGLKRVPLDTSIQVGNICLRFNPHSGGIAELNAPAGRRRADSRHPLGVLEYTVFSQADYDRYYKQYAQDTHLHGFWILPDITKPGMPRGLRHTLWDARLRALYVGPNRVHEGHTTIVEELQFPPECTRRYGAPGRVFQEWTLPEIHRGVLFQQVTWFDKPACRLPEALWLRYSPPATNRGWRLQKLGLSGIDPLKVAAHGGRQLHAVDGPVTFAQGRQSWSLLSVDAPLIAPGAEDLLDFSTRQPDMRKGIRVNLYNNTWGTNFPMWYDDDARFFFVMGI